ncbi:MAG: (d)CMP kinase [Nocardioidaceae bacterium]|nr:(d)CMP kinase [Nocardioidaceae bacterium]
MVIAIDGTAGSGKSSTSRGVAARLGLRYLDSGAMYRAMAWQMLLKGVDVGDPDAVAAHAESVRIESGTDPADPTIHLSGTDVSRQIRFAETTMAVSAVSAVPRVRELLVHLQRAIIGEGGIVVEGRDIGTVVAPDAALKIYLVADPAARAARRSAELGEDQVQDVRSVQQDLVRRDSVDSTRATSPLSAADDAVVVDSTELSLDEVVETIVTLAEDRLSSQAGD